MLLTFNVFSVADSNFGGDDEDDDDDQEDDSKYYMDNDATVSDDGSLKMPVVRVKERLVKPLVQESIQKYSFPYTASICTTTTAACHIQDRPFMPPI